MTFEAVWNGEVIARSDKTVELEGNHYFPMDSVDRGYLLESNTETVCPWKGTAIYCHIQVGSELNKDAAWYYPTPTEAANSIKDHLAFWNGVEIRSS